MSNIINIGSSVKMRGEYRAILRGPDGQIKHNSGWRPNMILNGGLYHMLNGAAALSAMGLGDSDIPAVETQTGGQGNYLGGSSVKETATMGAYGAPNYERTCSTPYVFAPGLATGTVKEFVLSNNTTSNYFTDYGSIRVVLDIPIIKGEFDELTIEHKLWVYPDITDHTGVIAIDGVDYNYTVREWGINVAYGVENISSLLGWIFSPVKVSYGYPVGHAVEEPLITITDREPDHSSSIGFFEEVANSMGGTSPNYYKNCVVTAPVDRMNGDFNKLMFVRNTGAGESAGLSKGMQIQLLRVSDGASFTKENTHEFILTFRMYSSRYTP